MKTKFNLRNSNNTSEYFGTITDGCYKLNVVVKNITDEKLDFDIGAQLEFVGDIQEEGLLNFF